MKAVQFRRFGGPEVLELVEAPAPMPGPREVRLRVHAAGVNLSDTLLRQDRYAVTPELPFVPGTEVTGVIEAVGEDVMHLEPGMRAAAALFATPAPAGGYAEQVVVDADYVVPLPDGLGFEEATALMVQGLTALHLVRFAPPAGKTVLVSAAAGGVGSLLVQLAKRAGATQVIAAASSARKLAFARSLGADAGVDYTADGWTDALRTATGGRGPDLVYESVGGDVTMQALAALAPEGRLVIYGALNIQRFALGVPELLGLIFRNQSVSGFAVAPLLTPALLREGLAELFALAGRGELVVTVGERFPLARAAEAHRALEGRGTTGKVVLVP